MAVALSEGCFWPERSKGTREQCRPPFNVQTSHLEILSVKLYILIQEVCFSDKPPGNAGASGYPPHRAASSSSGI